MTDPANAKRDSAISRARKLASMTTERGATEAEAIAALAMLERLRLEYAIGEDELSIRADAKNCIRDGMTQLRASNVAWKRLAVAIERLYGTITWIERTREDTLGLGFEVDALTIYYYGFPQDVAGSIAMLAICSTALDSAIIALAKAEPIIGRRSRAKLDAYAEKRVQFELGMTARLNERIGEMLQRSRGPVQAPGQLVLLKDKLVKDEFTTAFPGVSLRQAQAPQANTSSQHYQAGARAANAVPLDTRVSGAVQGRLS